MKLTNFVRDKINYILGFIVYDFIIVVYLKAMKVNVNVIWIVVFISCVFFVLGFVINFWSKMRYLKSIFQMMENLEEKKLTHNPTDLE